MSELFIGTNQNPNGLNIGNREFFAYNRTGGALVVGRVYQLDMAQTATETTTYEGTGDASSFGAIVAVDTTGATGYPLVVALDTAADNAKAKVCLSGILDVYVEGTNAAAVGEMLHATNGQAALNSDAAAGDRAVGIALATTASGTAALAKCLFDGTGLGTK